MFSSNPVARYVALMDLQGKNCSQNVKNILNNLLAHMCKIETKVKFLLKSQRILLQNF